MPQLAVFPLLAVSLSLIFFDFNSVNSIYSSEWLYFRHATKLVVLQDFLILPSMHTHVLQFLQITYLVSFKRRNCLQNNHKVGHEWIIIGLE